MIAFIILNLVLFKLFLIQNYAKIQYIIHLSYIIHFSYIIEVRYDGIMTLGNCLDFRSLSRHVFVGFLGPILQNVIEMSFAM